MSTDTYVVRELDGYGALKGGSACLAKIGNDYFVVSTILSAPDHGGAETLAFPCDADAEVSDWGDVAGGRGKSREDTIRELVEIGPDAESSGRGLFGDTKKESERTTGELLMGTLSAMETVVKEGLL